MVETSLANRMRALAEKRDDLPEGFLAAADKFDAATAGFYASPPTVGVAKFVGSFARARRLWCEATGEELA